MTPSQHTPYPIQWFFGIVSLIFHLFVRTNPRCIVLTSFHGKGYRGNTKVIFESLIEHEHFEPVWLSTNPDIVAEIRRTFGEKYAAKIHSFRGLMNLGQSAATLFTHGTSDFPFVYIPRSSIRIQTYHGLPTKKGEYLRPDKNKNPGLLHRMILNYRFGSISYFLSSSPLVTEIYSSRFGLPENRFLEIGYPSYDELIKNEAPDKTYDQIWPDAPESDYFILYAPTFRRKKKTRWLPFADLDIKMFAAFLEKNRSILAFRAHPNEPLAIDEYQKFSPHFVNASQEKVESINTLIKLADVIITDYSSIYLEGLLRNVPVVFIPYDIETYERGLPLPYEKVTPGPKVSSQAELMDAIQNVFHDPNTYSMERKRIKKLYFSNNDGNSTDRMIQFLENKLLQ